MKERKTQAHYKKYTTAEQEDEKMRKQNVIIIVHMLLRNFQIDSIWLVSLSRYGAGPHQKVSRSTTRKRNRLYN